ncbi:MAG: hypothetical protein V1862_01010 [Methanobacteriota archaeon]
MTAEEELYNSSIGNKTIVPDKNKALSLEIESISNTLPKEDYLPDDIPIVGGRTPKTGLIFARNNTTCSSDIVNETLISDGNTTDQISDNTTTVLSKYESLGDIIKVKDWKALGEYTCKVKSENPEKFDDSLPTLADRLSKWNSQFPIQQQIVGSSCCG